MVDSKYLPISSYGVIGNLRTVAVIGLNGSIDWLCLPRLDSPSVFAGLLDRRRGGCFSIVPTGTWQSQQQYFGRTCILQTIFDTPGGRLTLTDWMPLSGDLDGSGGTRTVPAVYRRLQVEGGPIEVRLVWMPRPDYARGSTDISRLEPGYAARNGTYRVSLLGEVPSPQITGSVGGATLEAVFNLTAEHPRLYCVRHTASAEDADETWDVAAATATLDETADAWRRWTEKPEAEEARSRAAADTEMIVRSELTLRLLTDGDTGAVAAAATTSLPEVIGGVRNWDYRYAWIRDASQTVESFLTYGHAAEAVDFLRFMRRCIQPRMQEGKSVGIVYAVDGDPELPQWELEHVEGYRGSRPVHVGNQAYKQTQHDSYGEILHSAYEVARRGIPLDDDLRAFLALLADTVCDKWCEPDHGLWEMPGEAKHFVYTKGLCWVALDRALKLQRWGLQGDAARWRRVRDEIANEILSRGVDPDRHAFRQTYETPHPDASNLLLPMHELLEYDDPRVQATIKWTIAELVENDLVYRYRNDDGLPGEEGAFGICGFWLADALAFSGRHEEAQTYFEAMAGRANHLGLFSEQYAPADGEALGNVPQGLTHIGFLDSAFHLAYARNGSMPGCPPVGSPQHRRGRE